LRLTEILLAVAAGRSRPPSAGDSPRLRGDERACTDGGDVTVDKQDTREDDDGQK